jgi:hypothetical protein
MASIAQCKLAGGGQLVQINAAGIPGPTGAQGPAGVQGPTGPTGPNIVTAGTACSTGVWSSTITFGADGDLYCGSPLTVTTGGGVVLFAPEVGVGFPVLGGFAGATPGGTTHCGDGPGYAPLPCSGVVEAGAAGGVSVWDSVPFSLQCPDGSVKDSIFLLRRWTAVCDWTSSGPATVTIAPPLT